MIKMTIEIDLAPVGGNEFGAGVQVFTNIADPRAQPQAVGATFVGICLAINDYMHSRGAPGFDCLKQSKLRP